MNKSSFPSITGVFVATALIGLSFGHATAQSTTTPGYVIGTPPPGCVLGQMRCITQQMREAAAKRAKAAGKKRLKAGLTPLGFPDYFNVANYALSPLPITTLDPVTFLANGVTGKGIRKFVDSLPGVGSKNANNLGNYIPLALPIVGRAGVPADGDYYEIAVKEYSQQMHSDLPFTQLRSYRDMNPAAIGNPLAGDNNPHYLGPIIIARKDRAVRVKFTNELLPNSVLFLPVDTTVMGAGTGVQGAYSQNRATLHLHGGTNPWISDGTPHQWITPAGDPAVQHKGISQRDVPDMWWNAGVSVAPGTLGASTNPGDGMATFYFANQQGSRLQFYHDHAYGLTRLNVYAGEAAGYLITDPAEDAMIASGAIPGKNMPPEYKYGIPLILQDKSFVPSSLPNANFPLPGGQLAAQDPTWDSLHWGPMGNLWFPHVYTPNQNPADMSGANAFGRWDYGPWFWPPQNGSTYVVGGQPVIGSGINGCALGLVCPGTPNPSNTPESFMDTMLVNGTPYPFLSVTSQAYRFRILNASNDRTLNLSLFLADTSATAPAVFAAPGLAMATGTEVKMVGAVPPVFVAKLPCIETGVTATKDPVTQLPNNPVGCWPAAWPTDGRDGGVPDPLTAGPAFIQIGTEGGLLPAPAIVAPGPNNYNYNRRDIVVLNVAEHGLFLMPAQRADVIVDFSTYAAGTKIILYNDAPAPVPAFDPRIDYYTGDPDQTTTGGAPTTLAGWGPNTRTVMQFIVTGPAASPDVLNTLLLNTSLPIAYAATQPPPIIPQKAYDAAFGTTTAIDTYFRISDHTLTFTPSGSLIPITMPMAPKAIQELFTLDYGRMNATLGTEVPFTVSTTQTTIPYGYIDPITEFVVDGQPTLWRITHNGVDSHPVHFHLFNVQVINRTGWDGAIRPPAPNELGWKETVEMNPLEDVVVAFKPVSMSNLPFAVPDSVRLLDVTAAPGTTGQFSGIDQFNNPITVTNVMTNFGWEYVWHCHILGHEENDFMRPVKFIGKATMVSPTIGTKLLVNSATFVWAGGSGLDSTYLWVGSTLGTSNLYVGTPSTTIVSALVNNLPMGSTIYVRLFSVIAGTVMFNDYTYLTPTLAIFTPVNGSKFTSPSTTFTYGAAAGVTQYQLFFGTTKGSANLGVAQPGMATTYIATTLPTNGATIFVRFYAMINGTWVSADYSYTAFNLQIPVVTTPINGSTFTSASVTFTWTPLAGATSYQLWLGSVAGGTDLGVCAPGTVAACTMTTPSNGTTVYAKLWTQFNGVWLNSSTVYTALSRISPAIVTPAPPTLVGTTATFTWTLAPGVTQYQLWIGTVLGGVNVKVVALAPTTASYAATGLPAAGTLYVRLWSQVGGVWTFKDAIYTGR